MTHLEILEQKIVDVKNLERTLMIWRLKSNTVVFTNGCFDILHQGHIDYLCKAKDFGDKLVVAVNSDASVKRLEKGSSRPIQDERSRALILASLHVVDLVVLFDENTPEELIKITRPDVLVKGADYDANETDPKNKKFIVGSDFVRSYGGNVAAIPFLEGYSTTKIETKIRTSP
jgi:D-glycero-beta-D-manno-heptose 1-phosphate adenylyltransferase